MSDELLDYAIAQVEKWGDMGHMPLVKKLVERVLDAEAERDALADWARDLDAELKRARAERDALRAIVTGISGPCPTPQQWKQICTKAREVDAALGGAP